MIGQLLSLGNLFDSSSPMLLYWIVVAVYIMLLCFLIIYQLFRPLIIADFPHQEYSAEVLEDYRPGNVLLASETIFLGLLNKFREDRFLPELKPNRKLRRLAREELKDLVASGRLFPNRNEYVINDALELGATDAIIIKATSDEGAEGLLNNYMSYTIDRAKITYRNYNSIGVASEIVDGTFWNLCVLAHVPE